MKNILIFWLVLCSHIVQAQTPIKILTTNEAPFQFQNKEKIQSGASYEILQLLLKETGYENTKVKFYPWARSYKIAKSKENTLIFSMLRNKERNNLFHWICPLYEIEYEVWKLKSRIDIKVNKLDDIKKYKLGLWRDDVRHIYFKSKGFDNNIQLVNTDKQNILKLLKGRTELYIGNKAQLKYQLNKWNLSDKFIKLESIYKLDETRNTLFIAFSLGTEQIILDKFSKAITTIKKGSKYNEILDKYGL